MKLNIVYGTNQQVLFPPDKWEHKNVDDYTNQRVIQTLTHKKEDK